MPATPASDRESFWWNLIARRAALQLTVGEACAQAGVSPASFFQWQKKFREAGRPPDRGPERSAPLVPVRIVDDRVAELTLELPHGLRLRLPGDCDEATLGRVLRAALATCRELESC
jgi:transposase-like protein